MTNEEFQKTILEEFKELKKDIEELRQGLANVEIITGSNWSNIAKIKSIR